MCAEFLCLFVVKMQWKKEGGEFQLAVIEARAEKDWQDSWDQMKVLTKGQAWKERGGQVHSVH